MTSGLRLICGSHGEFKQALSAYPDRILGTFVYSAYEPTSTDVEFPYAWISLPVVGMESWYEIWVSEQPVSYLYETGIKIAEDGEFLFGTLILDQHEELVPQTFQAYTKILDVLERKAYPQLLRAWHYFPRINDVGMNLERYREFNVGRHDAFSRRGGVAQEGGVPAACALGTREGSMVITFLAGKRSGLAIENPRQIQAYRYPADYGPRSPIFSRAILLDDTLLISGTASIVGSETVHRGNVMGQLEETITNIQAVIDRARTSGFNNMYNAPCLNVYLRNKNDYSVVRGKLNTAFPGAHLVFLEADICRADLLIEIEMFWMPQ